MLQKQYDQIKQKKLEIKISTALQLDYEKKNFKSYTYSKSEYNINYNLTIHN